jgi:hypothetical protein
MGSEAEEVDVKATHPAQKKTIATRPIPDLFRFISPPVLQFTS